MPGTPKIIGALHLAILIRFIFYFSKPHVKRQSRVIFVARILTRITKGAEHRNIHSQNTNFIFNVTVLRTYDFRRGYIFSTKITVRCTFLHPIHYIFSKVGCQAAEPRNIYRNKFPAKAIKRQSHAIFIETNSQQKPSSGRAAQYAAQRASMLDLQSAFVAIGITRNHQRCGAPEYLYKKKHSQF